MSINFSNNIQSPIYSISSIDYQNNITIPNDGEIIIIYDYKVIDGNIITKPDYVGFYNRNFSQKVDQYRIVDGEEIIITESGSNKRAQFGSSSSYTYGTCVIKMKFKLKYQ